MAKKHIISLELQKEKFVRNLHRLVRDTEINEKEALRDATVDFTDFAAKYTMPDKGKKYISKKRYKREIKEMTSRRTLKKNGKVKKIFTVMIARRGKSRIFRYANSKSKLKKYEKITYRGLGRAGWFLNLPGSINTRLTPAQSRLLDLSPQIKSKSSINEIRLTEKSSTIVNNSPQIEAYAHIAMAQGYRAAARKINRRRLDFLKKQEANPL